MLVPDSEYCSDSECRSVPPAATTLAPACASANAAAGAAGATAAAPLPVRYNADQRALLFGSRFGRTMELNGKGKAASAAYAAQQAAMLEEQNDVLTEELYEKVSELKQASLEINKELTQSHGLLDSMDSAFGRAQGLLTRTNKHVRELTKQSGSSHMWQMVLFIILLLIALYFFATARGMAGSGTFLAPVEDTASTPAPGIAPIRP